nr:hypothetical protein [Tanacetum cinerariifolium]
AASIGERPGEACYYSGIVDLLNFIIILLLVVIWVLVSAWFDSCLNPNSLGFLVLAAKRENLLERIRRSRELRATTLSDECINPGMFDYNGNLNPSKSILKKGISPTKEGRKVSMNASTMVWEVVTYYTSPIKPVFNRDDGYLPNASDNEPVQVAKEIGKVLNDGEIEDVATTVNTASDKVLNSFASVLKHKVNRVAEIMELRNDECVEGAAVMIPLAAIEEVTSRFENTLYGYFVGKRMNRVLDYGAWLIRRVPLLLNIWSPNSDLHKAGRSAYARALIEISAEDVLKEDLLSKVVTPAVVTNIELNHSKDVADDGFENVAPMSTGNVASTSSVPTTTSTIGSGASAAKFKVSLNNSFSALNDDEDSEWQNTQQVLGVLNESDSDVDEVITFNDRGDSLKIT